MGTDHEAMIGLLMGKLALTYGKRFTHLYDADPDTVRAHWAQELAGVSAQGLRYAMERLPADYVPNVLQIRALACNRPQDDHKRLPAPQASPENRTVYLKGLKELREHFLMPDHTKDPLAWAEKTLKEPDKHSRAAVRLAMDALRARGRL